jgi:hypothetical protein
MKEENARIITRFFDALAGGWAIGIANLIGAALTGKVPGICGVFGRFLVPGNPRQGLAVPISH